ncbi:thiosulfate oxidation carrier protein SoxY [Massilia sp. W12]|uniref:thiosulfate oxidation carrier protein SoxY n=1 Tax=Massilia sp. W12 TaxID=3126507 RepID=UPI0030CE2FBA
MSKSITRRDALRFAGVLSLAFGAGWLRPQDVLAADWNGRAFEAKTLADVLQALGGDKFEVSPLLQLNAPDIAENGAVVPVGVSSSANLSKIAILVEKNPNPLSAAFDLAPGTLAQVSTRVKMGATSTVHALALADGKWLLASKEIKVTLGGCGG